MILRIFATTVLVSTVFTLASTSPRSAPQCCDGLNILRKGECSNGLPPTGIQCDNGMYLLNPVDESEFDNFTTDSDFNLIIHGESGHPLPPEEYCLSQMYTGNASTTEVALVCMANESDYPSNTKYVVSGICCIISIICIIATLITYTIVPELRDLQGKCLMITISCLAVAFSFLSYLQLGINLELYTCRINASLLYFWFMATFFWLNVVCIQVWKTIVYPFILGTEKQWFLIYNLYGWGAPIIFTITTIVADNVDGDHIHPNFGESKCWFHGVEASWAYFYGPIAFLLFCNLCLFIATSLKLWKNMENGSAAKIRSHRYKCLLYLKLFLIMGITWMFELISFICGDYGKHYWVITDFINALQGFIIFMLLVVLRKRALRGLARRGLCCRQIPKTWVTMVEEDCEELDADEEDLSPKRTTATPPTRQLPQAAV